MQRGGKGREDYCGLLIYSRLGIIPLFFFFFVPEFQSVGVLNSVLASIQFLFFSQHILITLQAMRKQLDPRIPALINNGVKANHRSFFVMVGDKGRDQVRSSLQATMQFD